MGRTVTLEEIKDRSATDLLQEVIQGHEPLIVMLEEGAAISIQHYEPSDNSFEENLVMKPLPQFSILIPDGWKDAVYGEDGSGAA